MDGKTVYLVDFKGEKHIISKTLEILESLVSAQQFYRINRQAIKDVVPYTNQRVVVHLTLATPEDVIVSRAKVKPFLNWIEKG